MHLISLNRAIEKYSYICCGFLFKIQRGIFVARHIPSCLAVYVEQNSKLVNLLTVTVDEE